MKVLIIIFLVALCSTFGLSSDYSYQTMELNNYLNKNFNYQISDSIKYIIVINLDDCASCVKSRLEAPNQFKSIKDSVLVILHFSGRFLKDKYKKFTNEYFCLLDNKAAFSRSKLGSNINVIFSLRNKKIVNISKINDYEDIKTLIRNQ